MENLSGPQHDYFLWRQGRIFVETARENFATWIFNIIGFTLSVGLVLMGYTYGKAASERILAASSSNSPKVSVTVYPTRPIVPTRPQEKPNADCPDGNQFISFNSLSLCLPNTFVKQSNSATSERYSRTGEEFVVSVDSPEQFPIHMCHFEQDITVDSNIATRTIFRQETETGCGEMVGFATTIYDTSVGTVQIHLWKEAGMYSEQETYEKIERSIKI
jgi:hypothetical protein